ncbi:MAG: uroporphyrinogen decarboxylase family protein [Armatimonadota bacterium]
MTPRERLLAFLSNEPTDRVPIWLLFPFHPTSYYADVRALPQYREIYRASLERAVYLNRRDFGVPLFTPEVETTHEELIDGQDRVTRTTYRYREMRLTEESRRTPDGPRRKPLLNTDEDLAAFARFPLELDESRLAASLDAQIARWRAEAAEFPPHLGAMMNSLGEPVGVIYHRANLEEYAVWSLTASEQVEAILDALMVQSRFLYRYLLEREIGDVVFMVGSELASPPLVSRATFQRWVVPYAQELVALVHAYGKKVIQHYHGQIREILPDFLTMAPDALHTIEAPPVGNCTLTEAFAVVGDRIGLIGNIQYDEFHRLTPDQMEDTVRACLDECRGRRFMLSPSAGPYETDVPPRLRENYLRFMEAGWKYGG